MHSVWNWIVTFNLIRTCSKCAPFIWSWFLSNIKKRFLYFSSTSIFPRSSVVGRHFRKISPFNVTQSRRHVATDQANEKVWELMFPENWEQIFPGNNIELYDVVSTSSDWRIFYWRMNARCALFVYFTRPLIWFKFPTTRFLPAINKNSTVVCGF